MSYIRKLFLVILSVVIYCCADKGITVHAEAISGELEVIMILSEEEMRPYLDEFEKKYPGVTIKYMVCQNYEEDMKKRMEEGDYGDVFFLPSFLTEEDFSTYLEPIGTMTALSQKYNFMEQSCQINGVVYGVPSYAYLSGILYNKEVFHKAGITELPKTIDQFIESMHLIELHTDAIPFYTNYRDEFVLKFWETFPYIEMTGDAGYRYGDFLNDVNPYRDGTSHYKVYRMLYDMVELGYTEDGDSTIDWAESKKLLNEGKIGCVAIGSWAVSQFKQAGEYADNIGFMPFPNTVDGKQYMTAYTDYNYGISANTDNRTAAKAFIAYMLEESGFALEHENLSIVKTDPYPDTYELNENTVIQSNAVAAGQNYQLLLTLQKDLNLPNQREIQRVIDAARGKSNENFDDIMNDWNRRWEANRPDGIVADVGINGKVSEGVVFDNSIVQFSDVEKKFLLKNPTLKIGFLQNMAPLSYERNGYFCGAAYEICNLIAEKTGLHMSYYGYQNADELVQALVHGEIDMAAGLEKTVAHEGLIKYSKNYFDYYNVIIVNETVEANKLEGKIAAMPYGEPNIYWNAIERKSTHSSVGDCVEAVQDLKADYTITNHYSANYYVRDRECKNVEILPYTSAGALYLGFAGNTDATLIAICNKCIYSIANGDMEIALIKYMEPPVKSVTIRRFIETNMMLCFGISLAFFLVIVTGITVIMIEKDRSNKKHELDVKRYELLASLADEYMFEYDCEKNQIVFDKKFVTTFGFGGTINRNEYHNSNPALTRFLEQIDRIIEIEEESAITFSMKKGNGVKAWYRLITSRITDKSGKTVRLLGKLVNVQKEMEEMQNFQNKAERDVLTQLYNRDGFNKRIPEVVSDVMLAVIDLDNFKTVNDTLGHTGGDYCLMLLTRQLLDTMGEKAVIGRYGGDEFMLAIRGATVEECKNLLEQLVHKMDMEVTYQENRMRISISLGAAYSKGAIKRDELFEKADEALYRTKEKGKNGYHIEVCK
ncbi:MAG: GGDEF domain-containing protein [Lachnospiraceae bacterium]|nr:GGDEF domain-containing protein [Lachnospiraceae bacterium]